MPLARFSQGPQSGIGRRLLCILVQLGREHLRRGWFGCSGCAGAGCAAAAAGAPTRCWAPAGRAADGPGSPPRMPSMAAGTGDATVILGARGCRVSDEAYRIGRRLIRCLGGLSSLSGQQVVASQFDVRHSRPRRDPVRSLIIIRAVECRSLRGLGWPSGHLSPRLHPSVG